MADPYDAGLSQQFRDYMNDLDSATRNFAASVLREALGIKNIRNVQLWYATTGTQRNILNRKISTEEYQRREILIQSLIGARPANGLQKSVQKSGNPVAVGRKLSEYIDNPYTRKALTLITFQGDSMEIEYDAYGEDEGGSADLTDDDFEEFFEEP